MVSKVMFMLGFNVEAIGHVKVIVPTTENWRSQLTIAGYQIIPMVNDWNGLKAASGLVVADHAALESIKAKIPVILKQKEEAGEAVHSLNCVAMIDKDAPHRGAKFAMVPMLAAISLLG